MVRINTFSHPFFSFSFILVETKWRLGEWSGWSKCYCSKAYQKRNRECYSHGGVPCLGDTVETKPCQPKDCEGTCLNYLKNTLKHYCLHSNITVRTQTLLYTLKHYCLHSNITVYTQTLLSALKHYCLHGG